MSGIVAADVAALLDRTAPLWRGLADARLFVTGGTGFFGVWLLEALVAANRRFELDCRVTVLSRDPGRFAAQAPALAADPAIALVAGDVLDFPFPAGPLTHVIHAATQASAARWFCPSARTASPKALWCAARSGSGTAASRCTKCEKVRCR
jgi:hypothetical protein